MLELSIVEWLVVGLLFMWAGFVRSGLGFGGAALGLPLMLFVIDKPVVWLPIIGTHLLFFSGLTLRTRFNNVAWPYLRKSFVYIIPAAIVGVLGLLNLPNTWLLIFVYSVTLFYATTWLLNRVISSQNDWLDKFLLVAGGYVAGTSLTGAPLMVAVFIRHVNQAQLRNTLFVLWFILVSIKMTAFAALGVKLYFFTALALLPVAAIGHVIGLRMHEKILQNDQAFKRIIGGLLIFICLLGYWNIWR